MATLADKLATAPRAVREMFLARARGELHPLARYWEDPSLVMVDFMDRLGWKPTDAQRAVLRSTARQILSNWARQCGKTETLIAASLWTALCWAPALIVVVTPGDDQTCELMRRMRERYADMGEPVPMWENDRGAVRMMQFSNGSRIVGRPENQKTSRGFANVRLLVIDEASQVSDDMYKAVRPMLSASRGRLMAASTSFCKRGWFYEAKVYHPENWDIHEISAYQCPWHSPEFLRIEREEHGQRWFEQEYLNVFHDLEGSSFRQEDIDAACRWDEGRFGAAQCLY